ncbi:phage regulatory CII family protein [Comamonas terrae]
MGSTFAIGARAGYGDMQGDADIARGMCIQDAARLVAERFPGGVPALAVRMGVSANTLQHKLNPNNTTHKLTADESLAIQQISGLPFVLHAMAAALDFQCVPAVPDQSGGEPMEAFMRFQHGVGDFTAAAADAFGSGGGLSRNALRRMQEQGFDLIALIGHVIAVAAQMVPEVRDAA